MSFYPVGSSNTSQFEVGHKPTKKPSLTSLGIWAGSARVFDEGIICCHWATVYHKELLKIESDCWHIDCFCERSGEKWKSMFICRNNWSSGELRIIKVEGFHFHLGEHFHQFKGFSWSKSFKEALIQECNGLVLKSIQESLLIGVETSISFIQIPYEVQWWLVIQWCFLKKTQEKVCGMRIKLNKWFTKSEEGRKLLLDLKNLVAQSYPFIYMEKQVPEKKCWLNKFMNGPSAFRLFCCDQLWRASCFLWRKSELFGHVKRILHGSSSRSCWVVTALHGLLFDNWGSCIRHYWDFWSVEKSGSRIWSSVACRCQGDLRHP